MYCSSCNSSLCPCLESDIEEVEIEIDEYEEEEPISDLEYLKAELKCQK